MNPLEHAHVACSEGWFEPLTIATLSAGKINDSYRITCATEPGEYVLQAVNMRVFPNATALVQQLARVVAHLNAQRPGWVPDLMPTRSNASYWRYGDRVWRLWRFVVGEPLSDQSCPRAMLLERLRASGQAFATTQVLLQDLPGPRLLPGIDHHHDLGYFLRSYDEIASKVGASWQERVLRFREQPAALAQADGYIHGDCKPDNLLFRPGTAEVAAVLDLDTVMWGNRALDFGDLVRSSVWQQEAFDLTAFVALLQGFMEGQRQSHTPVDPQQLLGAPVFVSFMLSLRYLIDHLQGDLAFKVTQHGDNLERAERQYRRTEALQVAHGSMAAAISRWD